MILINSLISKGKKENKRCENTESNATKHSNPIDHKIIKKQPWTENPPSIPFIQQWLISVANNTKMQRKKGPEI